MYSLQLHSSAVVILGKWLFSPRRSNFLSVANHLSVKLPPENFHRYVKTKKRIVQNSSRDESPLRLQSDPTYHVPSIANPG